LLNQTKSFSEVRFIDNQKEKNIFFATLRQRVDGYFKEKKLSKHHNRQMIIKTIVLLSAYILPFIALLWFQPVIGISLGIWTLMGFAKAGIGMSIMHDANHGAYSLSSKTNKWVGYTINLVGGSVFTWKLQHNFLHHTYTNIVDLDNDIDDKLVMRFSPHTKVKWYQKFQFIYSFFFYGLLTLYWTLAKDFVQFHKYTKEGVNKGSRSQNKKVLIKIILSKIIYFLLFFVLPLVVLGMPVAEFVTGYLLMQFIAGVVLTVIFQLAHTVEETSHPLPDENLNIENNWAIHQMNTTVNFSRKSKFISWYVGGLNFQVEHHLFPTICHVHYPEIAHIVKTTALEFNIPYLENKTFMDALRSHIRILQKFGTPKEIAFG
jgi:linoleoyl-CoA desaturase